LNLRGRRANTPERSLKAIEIKTWMNIIPLSLSTKTIGPILKEKLMPRTRALPEEIADHFDSLPKAAGSAEQRVKATAKYFKIKPETVMKHLRFWWPGKKYLKEFNDGQIGRARWDRPTEELLDTLNKYGSVSGAARALKTTSITLAKAASQVVPSARVPSKRSNKD